MEGIQHRTECPAEDDRVVTTYRYSYEDGSVLVRRVCDYCRRAAVKREPAPEETSDEH